MFGLNWGGGLYVNYVLLICWVMDVTWWCCAVSTPTASALAAGSRVAWVLDFVIFNATIILRRILALGRLSVCLGLCLVWWLAAHDNSIQKPAKSSPTVAETKRMDCRRRDAPPDRWPLLHSRLLRVGERCRGGTGDGGTLRDGHRASA